MNKNGFGLIELLISVVIIATLYFVCFYDSSGSDNPLDDSSEINYKKSVIENKINEINSSNEMKKRIELNLNKGIK